MFGFLKQWITHSSHISTRPVRTREEMSDEKKLELLILGFFFGSSFSLAVAVYTHTPLNQAVPMWGCLSGMILASIALVIYHAVLRYRIRKDLEAFNKNSGPLINSWRDKFDLNK